MRSHNNGGRAAAMTALALLSACAGRSDRPDGSQAGYRPVADLPVRIGPPYQVRGRTYVPADDRRYAVTGLASWYGPESGSRTANGERFRPDAIGGAHPTLPLPSYVEVTALRTGRTILVRINDRGPFAPARVIDLSRGAARALGMEQDGTIAVQVRRVFPGEADRAALRAGRTAAARPPMADRDRRALLAGIGSAPAVPSPDPAADHADGFHVQVATLSDRGRAERLAREIGGQVKPAGALFRVRIGPISADGTSAVLARVRAAGYRDARLVRGADATLNGMEPPR